MSYRFTVPKGAINATQLHEELLRAGPWTELYVESTDSEIRLTIPSAAEESAARAVIADHVPKPPKDDKQIKRGAARKLKDLGFTDDEIGMIVR